MKLLYDIVAFENKTFHEAMIPNFAVMANANTEHPLSPIMDVFYLTNKHGQPMVNV
jgi:hypothetical protein